MCFNLPVVPHHTPSPPAGLVARVERYARELRNRSELATNSLFVPLQTSRLGDAPTLHLDDQSEVPFLKNGHDIRFRQDFARFRAVEGDLVGFYAAPVAGFEAYCRDRLGLGEAEWIRPQGSSTEQMHLAAALWQSPNSRRVLIEAARRRGKLWIDPYKGTFAVWELALLLKEHSECEVKVIAPPPQLTAWVNNKLEFAETVRHLFSSRLIPQTERAGNLAIAARHVQRLAHNNEKIVLKLPESVGGGGNVLLEGERFRGKTLKSIWRALRKTFEDYNWSGECELLVGEWDSAVISAPSVQTWVPPGDELPIIEGVFEQSFGNETGAFNGVTKADLTPGLQQKVVDKAWLLARLYQLLGYVGRCSFDLLLVEGKSRPQFKFIECNGRWGSASLPMMLMNRLFGDWTSRPYMFHTHDDLGLEHVSFEQLLETLGDDLYDARTGQGRWILLNPACLAARGNFSAISLADTWQAAGEASAELREKLQRGAARPVAQ